jgi:hypothetical protein
MGKHSRGRRNNSGNMLVNFCSANDLFICNSAFKHDAKHITTWSQHKKEKNTSKMITIFNQIDYIITTKQQAHAMKDSRSYSGTETSSDHRLVVTRTNIEWAKLYNRKTSRNNTKRFRTQILVNNREKNTKHNWKKPSQIWKTTIGKI